MTVSPRGPRATGVLGAALVLSLVLAGCGADVSEDDPDRRSSSAPPSAPTTGNTPSATGAGGSDELSIARSETREDTVYPEVGDPLVDALHYDLGLTWDPSEDQLTGRQVLTFRATADAARIPLDFNDALTISELSVDGEPAAFQVRGKDLTIDHPVRADQRYEIEIAYAGTPEPTPAPSQRSDFGAGLGWSITPEHETWTLQEPYGAHTWYAVNDQPADKALYDFTLTVPAPWSGVANGVLTKSTEADGLQTDVWHLAEPASSYLVTVAFGDFQRTDLESDSGVPIQIWTDPDKDPLPGDTEYAAEAIDWLEDILGPYPFDSFGIVVVDNESGMETQTMVTLGDTAYSLSAAVVVHEAAHHWYGNSVSPADWSEVWMNEGMVMYLQGMWEAEQEGISIVEKMDQWAAAETSMRAESGPPADYDPTRFGDGNIYYGPALMWQELRERIGDERFLEMVRAWPEQQENDIADRDEYWAWIEETTGEELTAFFEAWLLGAQTPRR
ncbi:MULTISPECIES: M1 family metallopeptidase [Nocardioides]|uniref:Aminopeptidase N n=1 Tax=Nocardioides vastitatis TaxID=2568655 RepID=A0ABW0ZHL7_9ACTN|nr:M1 family metallopeptidase [Nocardioides sp.]THI91793.1 M1 family metallopeptidase [Nocardioides sp.]